MELLMEVVSSHNNIIILGDINIHLNEAEDADAKALYDIFESIQHYPAHKVPYT